MRHRLAARRPALALAAALATATILYAAPPSGPGATLTLSEYRSLIQQARLTSSFRRVPPSDAADMSRQLRAVSGVTLPDGKTLPVSMKTEADDFAQLAKSPGGGKPPEGLATRLRALADQLRASSPATKGDPNAEAAAILQEKQFAVGKPPDTKLNLNFWDKIGRWLSKVLDSFFRGLEKFFRWLFRNRQTPNAPNLGMSGLGDMIQFILIFLACVLATVGIYFLSRWGIRQYRRRKGTLKDEPGGATGLDLTDEGITDPLATAKTLAAQGEYRGAIRLIYIASLHRLAGNGLLVLERNRTNWEYQRALRSVSREAYDTLLPATRLFDRVWYGRLSGTQAEYEGLVRLFERLEGFASAAGASVPLDRVSRPGSPSSPRGGEEGEPGRLDRNPTQSAAGNTVQRDAGARRGGDPSPNGDKPTGGNSW